MTVVEELNQMQETKARNDERLNEWKTGYIRIENLTDKLRVTMRSGASFRSPDEVFMIEVQQLAGQFFYDWEVSNGWRSCTTWYARTRWDADAIFASLVEREKRYL